MLTEFDNTAILVRPPVLWREYVWVCPWGHWIADFEMCRECWAEGNHSCREQRAKGITHQGQRGVFVWHNIHFEASLPEDSLVWTMLSEGQEHEPEITNLICLHRLNEEISSPDENLISEEVPWPDW